MHRITLATSFIAAMAMIVGVGCSEDNPAGDSTTCEATFRWLQKDAYRDTAGRSIALWPPHTTTTLLITCQTGSAAAVVVHDLFMANHGTEPGATDAVGDTILVEMRNETLTDLTAAEADALAAAYLECECANGGTDFLSLDDLSGATIEAVVGELSVYMTDHLDCGGNPPVADLVTALQAGDIETVLAALPDCTWEADHDWSTGLSDALLGVLASVQETLADYHVCNNDASLQAELWDTLWTNGVVDVCDPTAPICQGPLWLYEP